MSLRFYNTLTRSLQPFEPLVPGTARVYACGPTVYQLPHIGNYRTFLFNDVLRRYLTWKGYQVRFVMNLTDVDDKTIAGALQQGIPLHDYTAPIIQGFFEDLHALGISDGVLYPRATEHIRDMVELIGQLVERGHAYRTEDGSVYFDIASFPGYGHLSRIDTVAIQAGAGLAGRDRVTADEYDKADIRDFALWKAAKEQDRAVGAVWPTPWGEGRPGWHIECSAMSMAELGESFDIHTGGEDLVFPHHEDEIAQSEAATRRQFVRYWLHVRHLMVDGEKMSKSKGNVFTLADLRARGHMPSAIRYLLLSAHYRSELNFTTDGLGDARAALRRVREFRDRLRREAATGASDAPFAARVPPREALAPSSGEEPSLGAAGARGLADFEAALDDDLNTPQALAALFGFVREGNAALDLARNGASEVERALQVLDRMDAVLGVIGLAEAESAAEVDADFAVWVEDRLERRRAARAARDFAMADAIRDELVAAGVSVEDTTDGVRWKKL
jgi:cysteinyl-tRNA synthetase